MRGTVAKAIMRSAREEEQESWLVRFPDGSHRWDGLERLYKRLKKIHKLGRV